MEAQYLTSEPQYSLKICLYNKKGCPMDTLLSSFQIRVRSISGNLIDLAYLQF